MDGRIRFVYATCGRRYFCIRIKKFADTKISGYVWTGPSMSRLFDLYIKGGSRETKEQKGTGGGRTGYGKREVVIPCPPPTAEEAERANS